MIVDLLSNAGVRLSHDCFSPLKIVPVDAKTTKVIDKEHVAIVAKMYFVPESNPRTDNSPSPA